MKLTAQDETDIRILRAPVEEDLALTRHQSHRPYCTSSAACSRTPGGGALSPLANSVTSRPWPTELARAMPAMRLHATHEGWPQRVADMGHQGDLHARASYRFNTAEAAPRA